MMATWFRPHDIATIESLDMLRDLIIMGWISAAALAVIIGVGVALIVWRTR